MSIKAKKSLGSRLATIITTTVLLFTSIPLIPQSLKDNTFNSITASADGTGYIADGGGGYSSGGFGPAFANKAAFGLRFYAVNADREIVRVYYYYFDYAGYPRALTVYESAEKAPSCAQAWAEWQAKGGKLNDQFRKNIVPHMSSVVY